MLILIALFGAKAISQEKKVIFTSDIDNFWIAYDSIKTAKNYSQKIQLINALYISKGTKGLKAFMEVREYNDTLWVDLIEKLPKFWNSVRHNTLEVKNKLPQFEQAIERLKQIYPELKDAEIYFAIGGVNTGGTVKDNAVLIGSEIATGDSKTDVSEFKNDWLKNVFQKQSMDHIVTLNIHEYIHTQQRGEKNQVLSQSIREGSCDFITELVMEQPLSTQYLTYGRNNAESVKSLFKKEMFTDNFTNWLYNGSQKGESADLGYYIGYEICKAYYNQATDKAKAIKTIIELNYDDDKAVEAFLMQSKFYPEKINKEKLIKEYDKNCPHIVKIGPFKNGATDVSTDIKELSITFSKEMKPNSYSINFSAKGKDYFPLTGVKGLEDNGKTLVLKAELKPNKEYEFVITNRGFQSADGYKLKENEYLVKFKTK
ncbi:hypothetical protein FEDK69T_04150 [Flavobacterium enshiense DK69]|nr:hypothetical protein FEDK69T_04150 [Flavobacterium enshiense DK69]